MCYARVLVARVGGAGFGLPAFWWIFGRFGVGVRCRFRRLLWVGCRWWFWWLFGGVCGWVYSLALTRSRLTDSRKTAHGSRLAGVRLLAVGVRVGVGVRPSNLIFLALIIFTVWWGGILQPNGNRKTANSMCPLTLTPTPIFPNTEYIRSVGGFGNLPNGGGEFRNRNHGFLLRSIQTIDKFSRTVGNFIEDLLILSNRAYFTWFRTALILVPAATIVTEVFLYNI